jgi:quercetin dioxygenase-like cupin family protein
MNEPQGSCETKGGPSVPAASGSRVLRLGADFRWQGVPAVEYKQAAEHHRGVTRISLVGEQGENTAFHTRYFEIAPRGFSSLEKHVHEHVVVVLRGQGEVRLGDAVHPLAFGDTVYVAPEEVHQFRNRSATEPFGFLCIVDARRDRPVIVTK